jgi:hypothetical protein
MSTIAITISNYFRDLGRLGTFLSLIGLRGANLHV